LSVTAYQVDGLAFDEGPHVYQWHGRRVPSVTTILAPLTDLSMVERGILERARRRGTQVHTMIELFENDDLDETSLSDELWCYLDQYKLFKAATQFVPVYVEGRLYSREHDYCGTFDLFGTIDGVPNLIDTKSGMVPKTAALQTAAYKQMGVELGLWSRTTRRRCLDLKQKTWRLTDEYVGRNDWDVFRAQLTVHQWTNQGNNA
jgi:hypothetical protein